MEFEHTPRVIIFFFPVTYNLYIDCQPMVNDVRELPTKSRKPTHILLLRLIKYFVL